MTVKMFKDTLKSTRISLLISGIQMEPGKWHYAFKTLFVINFLWIHTAVLGEIIWLVEGIQMRESFTELSYIAPCITISVLSSVKALFFYVHQDVLIDVVNRLENIHPITDDKKTRHEKTTEKEDSKDIVQRNIVEANTFLKSLIQLDFIVCFAVVVAFCLMPLLTMGYDYWTTGTCQVKFPFNVKYYFDLYSPAVWPFVYLQQVWATFIAFFNTFSTDTFFFAFCVFMRMHFRILQRRFQDAVGEEDDRQFVEAVKRHQDLIDLADQVEILYSKSTLLNIAGSSVLICLSAFNVTSVEDMGVVINFMAFLSMSLMQIFLMCYFGDMLMKSSTEISDAIYNSDWYKADQRMKRNVLFVITKSRKPCKLTAARFADVNLTAFTTILSRSWSLFALLKTVYK